MMKDLYVVVVVVVVVVVEVVVVVVVVVAVVFFGVLSLGSMAIHQIFPMRRGLYVV